MLHKKVHSLLWLADGHSFMCSIQERIWVTEICFLTMIVHLNMNHSVDINNSMSPPSPFIVKVTGPYLKVFLFTWKQHDWVLLQTHASSFVFAGLTITRMDFMSVILFLAHDALYFLLFYFLVINQSMKLEIDVLCCPLSGSCWSCTTGAARGQPA